jgi:hypothetical protein
VYEIPTKLFVNSYANSLMSPLRPQVGVVSNPYRGSAYLAFGRVFRLMASGWVYLGRLMLGLEGNECGKECIREGKS